MMNLRIISIITLVFIIFSSMLASCAKTLHVPGEGHTATAGFLADTGTELSSDLPEADYEGYHFRILRWRPDGMESAFDKDLYAETETGHILNDAVYLRNLTVSEQFNIKISAEYQDYNQVPQTVKNIVIAADDAYDLVYMRTYDSPSIIAEGYLTDFYKLPYVKLKKPWWNKNAAESLSIGGKLYLAVSDINVMDRDAAAGIVFNKKMAADLNLPDLFYIALQGHWTMDKMASFYKNAAQDVNGPARDDIWGLLAGSDMPAAFFNGSGALFAAKDKDGLPVYTFESEYNYAAAGKIIEILSDSLHVYRAGTDEAQLFENARGLFFGTRLDLVPAMRTSETDFGILPVPKFNDGQDRYYSFVSMHTSGMMSVPISAGDLTRTSIILESMAFESGKTVQAAYKDTLLLSKYTFDEESSAMLDIIFANRVFDIGILYGFGGLAADFNQLDALKDGAAALYAAKADVVANDILILTESIKTLNMKK